MAMQDSLPPTGVQAGSTVTPSKTSKSFFVEDLAVIEISVIVLNRIQQDHQLLTNDEAASTTFQMANNNLSLDTPVAQRLRINLIHH